MENRWIGLATLLAFTSCTAWHERHPPVDYTPKPSEDVRLTLPDTTVTMRASGVRGDSLVGVRSGSGSTAQSQRVAVALTDVVKLEVREFDGFKTAALIGGIALLGALIIAASVAASAGSFLEGGFE